MNKCAKKCLKVAAYAAIAIVAILFIVLELAAGPIVKGSAKAAGPMLLGADISISNANVHVLSGKIDLGGMVVGPVEGFEANLFEMETFKIDMDTMSVLRSSGPIVIHEIAIEDPVVTYELKGLRSNLQALLDKLGADKEKEKEKDEGKDEGKEGRKVVIEHFLFKGGRVRVAVLHGKGVVVPLPTIELKDIGAKNGGVTGVEATFQVIESIVTGTLKAVAEVIGDVGSLAVEGVEAVGGAAIDGAKAVGDAAVEGAKAIGGAAAKGIKAIGGLFSDDDGDAESADGAGKDAAAKDAGGTPAAENDAAPAAGGD